MYTFLVINQLSCAICVLENIWPAATLVKSKIHCRSNTDDQSIQTAKVLIIINNFFKRNKGYGWRGMSHLLRNIPAHQFLYLQGINIWFFLKSLLFCSHSKPVSNDIMPSPYGRIYANIATICLVCTGKAIRGAKWLLKKLVWVEDQTLNPEEIVLSSSQ